MVSTQPGILKMFFPVLRMSGILLVIVFGGKVGKYITKTNRGTYIRYTPSENILFNVKCLTMQVMIVAEAQWP